jgi:hypothetical protein
MRRRETVTIGSLVLSSEHSSETLDLLSQHFVDPRLFRSRWTRRVKDTHWTLIASFTFARPETFHAEAQLASWYGQLIELLDRSTRPGPEAGTDVGDFQWEGVLEHRVCTINLHLFVKARSGNELLRGLNSLADTEHALFCPVSCPVDSHYLAELRHPSLMLGAGLLQGAIRRRDRISSCEPPFWIRFFCQVKDPDWLWL